MDSWLSGTIQVRKDRHHIGPLTPVVTFHVAYHNSFNPYKAELRHGQEARKTGILTMGNPSMISHLQRVQFVRVALNNRHWISLRSGPVVNDRGDALNCPWVGLFSEPLLQVVPIN